MAYEYAKVCLTDDIPYPLDREFDYYIPAQMRSGITRGAFVTVPFGRGNRRRLALVTQLCEKSSTPEDKIKPIDSLCPDSMRLSEQLLGLCCYLKEQTLCTMGDAVHAMIPAAAMSRLSEYYMPTDTATTQKLSGRDREIYDYILARKKISEASLAAKFGPRVFDVLKKLMRGEKPILVELDPPRNAQLGGFIEGAGRIQRLSLIRRQSAVFPVAAKAPGQAEEHGPLRILVQTCRHIFAEGGKLFVHAHKRKSP